MNSPTREQLAYLGVGTIVVGSAWTFALWFVFGPATALMGLLVVSVGLLMTAVASADRERPPGEVRP